MRGRLTPVIFDFNLASMQRRIRECDANSVKSDAGGIISATRVAQTLHGDTAKHPRRTYKCNAGVFLQVRLGPLTRV